MSRGVPPRLPSLIMRLALDPGIAELVMGDLEEEFRERHARQGRHHAIRWYWKQAVTSSIGGRRRPGPQGSPRPTPRRKGSPIPVRDVIHGIRSFARRPGFTSVVVFILALGIAFVTMVTTLAHSVFLGSVPYGDPERIVVLWRKGPEPIHEREAMSYPNILDWVVGGEPFFDGLAAYTIAPSSMQTLDGPVRVSVTYVDPYFFEALDVDMAIGRPLVEADNRAPTGDAVVVLTHGFWQTVLGGDSEIEGRTIDLGGHPHTVVGVMSPKTRWLLHEPLEVVTPFRRSAVGMSPRVVEDRSLNTSIVVGRLKEGVTLAQAQAGMETVMLALRERYPDVNAGIEANVTSFSDLRSDFGRLNDIVMILGVAAGFVLALSCISVTLLLLARFVERSREFAVRMALGATPRRFVYQALAEGVSITLMAGAIGLGMAYAGIKLVFAGNPLKMYSYTELTMDSSVFLMTLALALATTLLFGMVPVLRSARSSFHDPLRQAGVGDGGRERNLLRRVLVVAQVALSVAVLAGAGLVVRSLYEVTNTDYGFDTENLVYMRLMLDGTRYDDEERRVVYRDLQQRIAALPGVTDSGLWGPGLPGSSTFFLLLAPEGRESDPSYTGLHSFIHLVTPGAMEGLGLQLVEGRMLDKSDDADAIPGMVVSEGLAAALWPGERAVGKRALDTRYDIWRTVVGVVSDARMRGLGRFHSETLRDVYITLDQNPTARTNVILRASGDRTSAVQMVRDAVAEIDPTRAVFDVSTMDESIAEDRQEIGFITTLMMLFAGTAAILTTVSIFSVISFAASRRTHEIGVRVALGGKSAHVVALVLNHAALDMALGTTIGVASALALGRVMSSLLYGITPTDPVTFVLILPVVIIIALIAAYVPVRRALAVDPCEALRRD